MSKKKVWLAMFKGPKGMLYLETTGEENFLRGYKTRADGLASFTKTYDRAHARGGTWSAAAMVHMIEYQPRIVFVENVEDLRGKVILTETAHVHSLWGTAGGMEGVECTGPDAAALYESGKVPELITEKGVAAARGELQNED